MERDRPDLLVFPPFAFFLALVLTFVLRHWVPLGVLKDVPQTSLSAIGLPIVVASLWLSISGILAFKRAATNINPRKPVIKVVRNGPYRFTRNPMYLGMILFVAGLGIAVSTLWGLLAAFVLWAVLHWGVVLREEVYLKAKFGPDYDILLASTRRWF